MGRWHDGEGGLAHCEGIRQAHRRGEVGATRFATDLCTALPCFGRRVGADPIPLGAYLSSNDRTISWLIKDVPQPQPGPGQVLVKMHASGICYTDVHQTLGHLPGPFPRILGHEPVGEIVATAPDVTARKVGDRVGSAWIQSTCGRCEWCQRGRKMFCPYLKVT